MGVTKKAFLLKSEYYVLHTDLTSAIAGLGQQHSAVQDDVIQHDLTLRPDD